jgi:hypothetical protein
MAASPRIQCPSITLTKTSRCRTVLSEISELPTLCSRPANQQSLEAHRLRVVVQQTTTKRWKSSRTPSRMSPRPLHQPLSTPAAHLQPGHGCRLCRLGRPRPRRCHLCPDKQRKGHRRPKSHLRLRSHLRPRGEVPTHKRNFPRLLMSSWIPWANTLKMRMMRMTRLGHHPRHRAQSGLLYARAV